MNTMNPLAKECREELKSKLINSVSDIITIPEINKSNTEQTAFQYSYEWYAIKINREVYQLFLDRGFHWIDADKTFALGFIKLSEIAETQNLKTTQKLTLTFKDNIYTLLAKNEFNTPKTTVELYKE